MKTKHDFAGYGTSAAICVFTVWAMSQHGFPQPEQVIERFNVSRATAHRWLNFFEAATCKDRPRRGAWVNWRAAA